MMNTVDNLGSIQRVLLVSWSRPPRLMDLLLLQGWNSFSASICSTDSVFLMGCKLQLSEKIVITVVLPFCLFSSDMVFWCGVLWGSLCWPVYLLSTLPQAPISDPSLIRCWHILLLLSQAALWQASWIVNQWLLDSFPLQCKAISECVQLPESNKAHHHNCCRPDISLTMNI